MPKSEVPKIGEFNRKVQFKNVSVSEYASGGQEEIVSAPFVECWAAVKFGSQGRTFDAAVDKQVTSYDIWVHYQATIASNLKRDTLITYNGLDYSIDSVELIDEERGFYHFKVVGVK